MTPNVMNALHKRGKMQMRMVISDHNRLQEAVRIRHYPMSWRIRRFCMAEPQPVTRNGRISIAGVCLSGIGLHFGKRTPHVKVRQQERT